MGLDPREVVCWCGEGELPPCGRSALQTVGLFLQPAKAGAGADLYLVETLLQLQAKPGAL